MSTGLSVVDSNQNLVVDCSVITLSFAGGY